MPMEGDEMEIRRLDLSLPRTASRVKAFLADAGLRLDEGVGYFAGLFGPDDELVGCGGLDGNVIKCLAMAPDARGTGACARLISHLMNEVFDAGSTNVRVFTKPECLDLFRSLGFSLCGEGRAAVLMESDGRNLRRYCDYLRQHEADGVIVANADPLTLGHLWLISQAAQQCSRLAVIAVGPHASHSFAYKARIDMLRKATAHLPNVDILEGSDYAVSQLSFPSYFIKRADDISRTQAEVDLDIFCRNIAPALGCRCRFVGTEPTDALTAQYNALMKELLPARGIAVVEMQRKADDAGPVSASRVRQALRDGRLADALPLVPPTDTPYLLAFLAVRALRKELALAPKPGLVDPYDSGAHDDMDYRLMSRSIDALRPYFDAIVVAAYERADLTCEALRELGMAAERDMMAATDGVNTHRGAIFSMGLAVAAAARIMAGHSRLSLSDEIAQLASGFPRPNNTHGQMVRQRFGIPGALENAQSGYAALFRSWLPFHQGGARTDADCLCLLLKIISELQDSNVVYRAGRDKAEEAQRRAARLLADGCTAQALSEMNDDFKRQRISHGGAADMLALTFFIDSIDNAIRNIK